MACWAIEEAMPVQPRLWLVGPCHRLGSGQFKCGPHLVLWWAHRNILLSGWILCVGQLDRFDVYHPNPSDVERCSCRSLEVLGHRSVVPLVQAVEPLVVRLASGATLCPVAVCMRGPVIVGWPVQLPGRVVGL